MNVLDSRSRCSVLTSQVWYRWLPYFQLSGGSHRYQYQTCQHSTHYILHLESNTFILYILYIYISGLESRIEYRYRVRPSCFWSLYCELYALLFYVLCTKRQGLSSSTVTVQVLYRILIIANDNDKLSIKPCNMQHGIAIIYYILWHHGCTCNHRTSLHTSYTDLRLRLSAKCAACCNSMPMPDAGNR